jgi:serine/threonine protein kinase
VTLESDPKTGKLLAVKHIRLPPSRAAFLREIESLAQLNHPCVLRICGWAFPDGSHSAQIQTEYAANGSLKRLLSDLKMGMTHCFWNPTGRALLICGIVLGMRYIHWSGIIHGDLKPGNILIDEHGRPLIGDFGASRLECDEATQTGKCGTLYYSAPELFEEGVTATAKSDVFSFGLVLYEMLVGSPVFSVSDSPFEVIERLQNGKLPVIPSKCGSLMQDLIPRCWSKDPNERPSFGDILALFQAHDFALFSSAKAATVRAYCADIREWEGKAEIPQ